MVAPGDPLVDSRKVITKRTLPVQTWSKYTVNGPTILQPIYFNLDDTLYGANFVPQLFIAYEKIPNTVNGTIEAYNSFNGGVCYLPTAGNWWIFNQNTVYNFDLLEIDASGPGVLQMYQNQDKASAVTQSNAQSGTAIDVTLAVGASTLCLAPNWYRTRAVFYVVSGANGILRIWGGTGTPQTNRGIPLIGTGSSYTEDNGCVKQRWTTINAGTGPLTFGVFEEQL